VKGAILHGRAGKRLGPLTFSGPKQLIPVANKLISQYVVEDLRDSGVRDLAIVLGKTYPDLVYGTLWRRLKVRHKNHLYMSRKAVGYHTVGPMQRLRWRKFAVYFGARLTLAWQEDPARYALKTSMRRGL